MNPTEPALKLLTDRVQTAAAAGVQPTVRVSDPRVMCDQLVNDDGRHFAVVLSVAADRVEIQLTVPVGTTLTELTGTPSQGHITLPPFGVAVLQTHG